MNNEHSTDENFIPSISSSASSQVWSACPPAAPPADPAAPEAVAHRRAVVVAGARLQAAEAAVDRPYRAEEAAAEGLRHPCRAEVEAAVVRRCRVEAEAGADPLRLREEVAEEERDCTSRCRG